MNAPRGRGRRRRSALAVVPRGRPSLSAPGVRDELLATPVTAELGGDTTRVIDSDESFTFLATNAPAERQRAFAFGNRVFNTKWAEYPASVQAFDGLGPTFNRNSCSGCHVRDGRGRPPANPGDPMESMLVRLSAHRTPSPIRGTATSSTTAPTSA